MTTLMTSERKALLLNITTPRLPAGVCLLHQPHHPTARRLRHNFYIHVTTIANSLRHWVREKLHGTLLNKISPIRRGESPVELALSEGPRLLVKPLIEGLNIHFRFDPRGPVLSVSVQTGDGVSFTAGVCCLRLCLSELTTSATALAAATAAIALEAQGSYIRPQWEGKTREPSSSVLLCLLPFKFPPRKLMQLVGGACSRTHTRVLADFCEYETISRRYHTCS